MRNPLIRILLFICLLYIYIFVYPLQTTSEEGWGGVCISLVGQRSGKGIGNFEHLFNILLNFLCLFSAGSSFHTSKRFSVYVEKNIWMSGITSFLMALESSFALFYIFNLMYPPSMSYLMEYIQR